MTTKKATASTYTASLSIKNSRGIPLTLHLEPWGDQIELPPDVALDVVAKASNEGAFEINLGDDHIAVWGWTGSILSVYKDGVEQ